MEDFSLIAKSFILYQKKMKDNGKEIEAITTALLGAIACGYKVKSLNINGNLKECDFVENYTFIFKNSNKNVDELEHLYKKHMIMYNENCCHYKVQEDRLVELCKSNKELFLCRFVEISKNKVKSKSKEYIRLFFLIKKWSELGLNAYVFSDDDFYYVFSSQKNKFLDLINFMSDEFDEEVRVKELNNPERFKTHLGYLFY